MKHLLMNELTQARRLTLFCTIFILLFMLLLSCTKKTELPSNFKGTWTTESEQYENRFIEIGGRLITFGTGEGDPNVYFIKKISCKKIDRSEEYIFTCSNTEDTEFKFIIYFERDESGLLMRLNNPRQVIWKKKTDELACTSCVLESCSFI